MRRKRMLIMVFMVAACMAVFATIAYAFVEMHAGGEARTAGEAVTPSVSQPTMPGEESLASSPPAFPDTQETQNPSSPTGTKPLADPSAPVLEAVGASQTTGHQYLTVRDAWQSGIFAPAEEMRQRVYRYARAVGMAYTEEEMRHACELAQWHGYDPRLWACIAMAESTGGRDSRNLYGFCGGPGSAWAYVPGDFTAQTEWFDNRICTFYARFVDISKPEQVLWFHHEGEPLSGRDPYSVFYVRNVMTWLVSI